MTQKMMMRILAKEGYRGEEANTLRKVIDEMMRVEGSSTIVDVFPWLKFFGLKWRFQEKFKGLAEEKEKIMDDLLKINPYAGNIRGGKEEEGDGSGISTNRLQKTLVQALLSLQKTEPEFYTDETIKGLCQVSFLPAS